MDSFFFFFPHSISLHLFKYFISFRNALWFSAYRSFKYFVKIIYVVVQSLSHVWLRPHATALQAFLSFTISWSLHKLMSIELTMPSNHLVLCRPLLLPLIFPSIRVFSNELAFHTRWPKYWSFSFSISPSNEYSGLISLGLAGLISLQSKRLSRVFSNSLLRRRLLLMVQKHQFVNTQPYLWSNTHIHTWLLEKSYLWLDGPLLVFKGTDNHNIPDSGSLCRKGRQMTMRRSHPLISTLGGSAGVWFIIMPSNLHRLHVYNTSMHQISYNRHNSFISIYINIP